MSKWDKRARRIGTYSSVLQGFYLIDLSWENYDLVDAHFFAASHHFHYSQSDDLPLSRFHQDLFWKHLTAMMRIVMQGDFSRANDLTNRGLHLPEGWNPNLRFTNDLGSPSGRSGLFPDPEMFVDMQADPTYLPGDTIPYDLLLERPAPRVSQIQHQQALA